MSDPHFTAEKVLEGRLVSQVRFTEFRNWMMAEHPDYLTDDELIALYDQHVKHRDISPVAQVMSDPTPSPVAKVMSDPKSLRQILEDAPSNVHPIAGEVGIDRARSADFLRAVQAPDKSTQPPLTKRLSRKAKKAARRARKRLRRHS